MDNLVQGPKEVPLPEEGTELLLDLQNPLAYLSMVGNLRKNPRVAPDYIGGIKSILKPHAALRGTLDYSPIQGFFIPLRAKCSVISVSSS